MNEYTLKLCPLCDGEAKITHPHYADTLYQVECTDCHCITSLYGTREGAIYAWNTRTNCPECIKED